MTKQELKKIQKEPFYNEIYKETNTFDVIDEGGFFFDSNDQKIDWNKHTNLLCTPINFLSHKSDTKRNCVIISTGAFSPLHDGHVDMFYEARTKLIDEGWNVMGGYLSPGHDEYIKQKTGSDWIAIHDRLTYAADKLKRAKYIALDPWEGVFAPGAVNFTTVVHRLHLYLKKHVGEDISIFFVCGADNARFALAFKNYQESQEFGTVIVKRPGYNNKIAKYESLKNVYVANCDSTLSSTQLRKQGFKLPTKPKQLYLRMFWNNFEKQIKTELQKEFDIIWPLDINEQNSNWKDAFNHSELNENQILNLDSDSFFGNEFNVSRLYDLYGQTQLGFTHRPESKFTIDQQISNLKIKGDVYLFDDDICSGKTLNHVENLLSEQNINVAGKFSYITSNKNTEVLDSKDFIINANGGLVVEYKGKLIRVPYIYPFVCPTTRASVSNPLDFSVRIWKLNMDFYKDKDTLLKDTNLNWMLKLGFNKNTTVFEMCEYYYLFLLDLKNYYI